MKICYIECGVHLVGGLRRVFETANRLLRRNHKVVVFTPKGGPIVWLPNKVPILPLSQLHKFEFDISIFNLADQYKIALSSNAKRKVFWVLAPEATYKAPEIPIQALQQPFHFLANSKYTVEYIRKRSNTKQKEIPIIPGGINRNHFRHEPDTPKDFDVLYYGSKRPWKGSSIIEDAVRLAKVKALKMEGMNTPQDKMHTLHNCCTMYVSANLSEGFSFGQLEAMMCGCTVLTTDDGGSRDYIIPNGNAIVVQRNASAIKDGISMLLNDKPLRRKLIKAGLATARQKKYTWEDVTDKLEKALTKIYLEQAPGAKFSS